MEVYFDICRYSNSLRCLLSCTAQHTPHVGISSPYVGAERTVRRTRNATIEFKHPPALGAAPYARPHGACRLASRDIVRPLDRLVPRCRPGSAPDARAVLMRRARTQRRRCCSARGVRTPRRRAASACAPGSNTSGARLRATDT